MRRIRLLIISVETVFKSVAHPENFNEIYFKINLCDMKSTNLCRQRNRAVLAINYTSRKEAQLLYSPMEKCDGNCESLEKEKG